MSVETECCPATVDAFVRSASDSRSLGTLFPSVCGGGRDVCEVVGKW